MSVRGIGAAVYDWINRGLEEQVHGPRRQRLLTSARGRILDVGAGTGANLRHYRTDQVERLVLLDVGSGMLERAGRKAAELGMGVELRTASAERLPFEDGSFDTVVFTLCLCTIPDPDRALSEARRVLAEDGQLLALEHVRAAEPGLARWQDRVNPFWRVVAGGCNLNRPTRRAIEGAGFELVSAEDVLEARIPIAVIRPWLVAVAKPARRPA